MSVNSAPYYWLGCDGCDARWEDGEFSAFQSPAQAIEWALSTEWTTDGEKHHCSDCPPLTGRGD
jgi:hypothetical protein